MRDCMSLGPQPAWDLSLYEGKQGFTTPNRLLKNISTAKAPLTRLLNALASSKD